MTNQLRMEIGQRLKQVRMALNFETRPAFAQMLGISRSQLKEMEDGRQWVSLELARQLYQRWNVQLMWLFFKEGSMFDKSEAPENDIFAAGAVAESEVQYVTAEKQDLDMVGMEIMRIVRQLSDQSRQEVLKYSEERLTLESISNKPKTRSSKTNNGP